METHDHRRADGTDAERVNFGVQEILHAVPAHRPTKTTDVYHHDSTRACMLLCSRENSIFVNIWDGCQECCHVAHGNGLKTNTNGQRSFPADSVDKEQSAGYRRNKFDHAKNRCSEKLQECQYGDYFDPNGNQRTFSFCPFVPSNANMSGA